MRETETERGERVSKNEYNSYPRSWSERERRRETEKNREKTNLITKSRHAD